MDATQRPDYLSPDHLGSDQLNIDTPELVSIEMPLAGIGSRFIALLVDYLIWGAGFTVLVLLLSVILPSMVVFSRISAQWTVALVVLFFFLVNWGYFTLFEAFWNGRTPGKRIARIRVIQSSGRAISLFESMARNLVRYIDQIPGVYVVGVITMFVTRQHQRLGDLAAGTLVCATATSRRPCGAIPEPAPSPRPALRPLHPRPSCMQDWPSRLPALPGCQWLTSACWKASSHAGSI